MNDLRVRVVIGGWIVTYRIEKGSMAPTEEAYTDQDELESRLHELIAEMEVDG